MKKWEQNIRKVVPYVPGEQPTGNNIIKLNTNENPYPPSPKAAKILKEFDNDKLKLYPESDIRSLNKCIAKYYNLDPRQVFSGIGSDDVLAMSFLTFFNGDKPILFPNITYSFYEVWADLYRIPYKTPPLNSDFKICKDDYYFENGGIVIANPNAPTGICEDLDFIEDIVKNNPDVIVIIDEAYIDFGGNSAIPLIDRYDNLLVVQTFSKARSLAGMRIGYAMGNEKLIEALNNVKQSYNSYTMNQISMACGIAAVEDVDYFNKCISKIVKTRERVKGELASLGFEFPDSKTNFIFARHRKMAAKDISAHLIKHSVYVRHFNIPYIDNYLRITVGTDEQMDRVLDILRNYI